MRRSEAYETASDSKAGAAGPGGPPIREAAPDSKAGGAEPGGPPPVIEMRGIVKVFPPALLALDRVDLTIRGGEIHSVIGENGAGKSTLMHVLYGTHAMNSGKVMLQGKAVDFSAPRDAVRAGIGMLHQEFMLIPSYSVYENVILGAEPVTRFGALDRRAAREKVFRLTEEYRLQLNPSARVDELSVAAQQKVEILKLLYRDAEILILDEPTAVLTPREIEELFKRLKAMSRNGKTVLFISHKLDEVLELSDSITVMRKGRRITTGENRNLTKADLARAMVGRDVVFTVEKTDAAPGETVLSLENIVEEGGGARAGGSRGGRGGPSGAAVLKNLSLNVRSGEIVGVAGVEGNGQFELIQVITGAAGAAEGRIVLEGRDITNLGIPERRGRFAYVPQKRKTEGSSQQSSLIDNTVMTHHRAGGRFRGRIKYLLPRRTARDFTQEVIHKFGVAAPGPRAAFGTLSGGNQQKIIIGREASLNRRFLLLDQPTRGLDVGSIESIRKRIISLRDRGAACLLISADLDELFALSDRLLVLYRGAVAAELNPKRTTKEEVGGYMLGAGTAGPEVNGQ